MKPGKRVRNQFGLSPTPNFSRRERNERGVALLLTIFGLLLLTAITTAMLFSSNSETLISVNYRDEQVATYAAISALQEARDRIQPASGDLALNGYVPTQLPGTTNGQVLYLINPNTASGESVTSIAPWNWNSGNNPYFDKELCQENMLGITPNAPGVVCQGQASVPSNACSHIGSAGGGWCFYYDDSADNTSTSNSAWTQTSPLNYKWVRISVKADNNTPVYVPSPTAASGKQVCWDGNYQSQLPSGYGTNCLPTAGNVVTGVNVVAGGSGYITPPTVTISGGGGSGATATAVLGPSSVGSITNSTVTAGGSGYTSVPTVTVASPDGTGATFQAVINGSPVTGVTVSNSGTNYCYPGSVTPTLTFSTTPSTNTISNASATVTMVSNGCIAAVTQTGGSCSGAANKSYSVGASGPPGGGSGFSGTVTYGSGGTVSSITINSVGSGYTTGSNTITTKGSCTVTPTFTTGYQISSATVSSGGSYMSAPSVVLGGSLPSAPVSPTYPTLASQWTAVPSPIIAINVLTGGSGYMQVLPYTLNITGGGGTGATATAAATTTNGVVGFNLTSGGAGYTSAPTVTLSGGGCTTSCATANATIGAGTVNTSMGRVYLLTSLAATKTGARAMAQMEVGVRPPFSLNLGGALTLAGPGASFGSPNSNNFQIQGNDGCGKAATKPAIGVYDNQSQTNVINNLGKPSNYTGAGGTPSVENVYSMLGGSSLTPANLNQDILDLQSQPSATVISGPATSLPSTTNSSLTVVDGNLTLSGDPNGNGILVVTGTLTLSGNFTWNGIVLIVGAGSVQNNGGGNGSMTGAMYVANIYSSTTSSYNPATATLSSTMGAPTFNWNGGGGNGIQYNSCQADALLKKYTGQPNPNPLQILSTRLLEF